MESGVMIKMVKYAAYSIDNVLLEPFFLKLLYYADLILICDGVENTFKKCWKNGFNKHYFKFNFWGQQGQKIPSLPKSNSKYYNLIFFDGR